MPPDATEFRADARSAGFTLIELLVVLAIMALMMGLALPYIGNSLAGTAQRAATAELRVALQSAASEAVERGRTVTFRADPDGGYWVDRRHGGLSSSSARQWKVGGTGQIAFYAWGGSSGGRLWIDGPAGRRQLSVDAVTGRAVAAP